MLDRLLSRPSSSLHPSPSWLGLSLAILLSLALFAVRVGTPISLLPLLGFALWHVIPRLGERADQQLFLVFLILCFVVDDISQVAWGREIETWTEQMGALLFESVGLTGLEYFALAFSLFLWVSRRPYQHQQWFRLGMMRILGIGLAIFLASCAAGIYGILTGAAPLTFFIQIRFLHNLALWTFIGFVLLRDPDFTFKLIGLITGLVILKSLQALYVYLDNIAYFREAEYLIEHYFSAFSVMALLTLSYSLLRLRNPLLLPLHVVSILVVMAAFILNDRRTSYVGAGLALVLVPFLMPRGWLRRYLPHMAGLGLLAVLYIAGTWNLPPPLGFVGATIQSFGRETGTEGPSYRDIENANLFTTIAQNPTFGLGYGREFEEVYELPFIAHVYPRYRMIPHNMFLAGWAYGGPLTIAATSLVFASLIWLSGRLMRGNYGPKLWFIGVISLFFSMQYFSFTFGDIGLQIGRNQMMAGLLLGGCYRLLAEVEQRRRKNSSE